MPIDWMVPHGPPLARVPKVGRPHRDRKKAKRKRRGH